MNKTRKRKLIERSVLFVIILLAWSLFIIFDLFFAYAYRIDGYKDLQWISYWTHLSNTAALIWVTLALIAVLADSNKLEHMIQHWNIKNTIFTFIISTGAVFLLVAYVPVVINYTRDGSIAELEELVRKMSFNGHINFVQTITDPLNKDALQSLDLDRSYLTEFGIEDLGIILDLANHPQESLLVTNYLIEHGFTVFATNSIHQAYSVHLDPTTMYRAWVIIGTTSKHVIVPLIFVYLAVTELGYFRTRNISDTRRSMIQFIWPCLYIIYATTLGACGLISPPYPVLDFGFTYSFYDKTVSEQCWYVAAAMILDVLMGVVFVLISRIQNWWNTSFFEAKISDTWDGHIPEEGFGDKLDDAQEILTQQFKVARTKIKESIDKTTSELSKRFNKERFTKDQKKSEDKSIEDKKEEKENNKDEEKKVD